MIGYPKPKGDHAAVNLSNLHHDVLTDHQSFFSIALDY